MRIISGGQTGVDRGALEAAVECGFAHGGYCPAGRRAEDGVIPPQFDMIETGRSDYLARTELNVISSAATLVLFFGDYTAGTKKTVQFCLKHRKPFLGLDLENEAMRSENLSQAAGFVSNLKVGDSLNVAGPRESRRPGIQEQAKGFMVDLLREINRV